MKLVFENSNGKMRVLGSYDTRKECLMAVHAFLEEHNFKSYYTRSWRKGNDEKLDVGSHTEFFHIIYDD